MLKMELILLLPWDVHVARVPVAIFRDTLRAPVIPNSKLDIAIPFRTFVLKQRVPSRLVGSVTLQSRDRRNHWDAVMRSAWNGQTGLGWVVCGSLVVSRIEALGSDLTIAERIKHALVFRYRAEARVIARDFVKRIRECGAWCCGLRCSSSKASDRFQKRCRGEAA